MNLPVLPFLGLPTAPIEFRTTTSGTAVAAVELAGDCDEFVTVLAIGSDAEKMADVFTMSAAFSVQDRHHTERCPDDIQATCLWNDGGDARQRGAARVTLRVVHDLTVD